jgi:hypothetical protein
MTNSRNTKTLHHLVVEGEARDRRKKADLRAKATKIEAGRYEYRNVRIERRANVVSTDYQWRLTVDPSAPIFYCNGHIARRPRTAHQDELAMTLHDAIDAVDRWYTHESRNAADGIAKFLSALTAAERKHATDLATLRSLLTKAHTLAAELGVDFEAEATDVAEEYAFNRAANAQ